MEKLTYSVDEMAATMGISRPKAYELANSEGFPIIRVGRRIRIPVSAFEHAEAQEARAHAVALYHEIDAAIKRISCPGWPDQRAVLQMRYLDGCRWLEITEMLFGGDPDYFDERQDSFLRRTHKIHGKALAALAKLVPLDVGRENNTEME